MRHGDKECVEISRKVRGRGNKRPKFRRRNKEE